MAKSLGAWAFLVGVVLAVIIGLISGGNISALWVAILAILGLIVGFLNVTDKESTPFMTAGVVLVIVSALGGEVMSSVPLAQGVLVAMNILFVPATVIVALKSVFSIAKD